jgi:hypothetical protein
MLQSGNCFQFPSRFQLMPSLKKLSAARSIAFRVLFRASQASETGSIPVARSRFQKTYLSFSHFQHPKLAGLQSWQPFLLGGGLENRLKKGEKIADDVRRPPDTKTESSELDRSNWNMLRKIHRLVLLKVIARYLKQTDTYRGNTGTGPLGS